MELCEIVYNVKLHWESLWGCAFNRRKCLKFFMSFEIKVCTCTFGKKIKADKSFSFKKYFYWVSCFKISFYDDNVNQMSPLTRDTCENAINEKL